MKEVRFVSVVVQFLGLNPVINSCICVFLFMMQLSYDHLKLDNFTSFVSDIGDLPSSLIIFLCLLFNE